MYYCIAYKDKDGSGFGRYPWVLDGFDDLERTVQTKKHLIGEGLKEVTIFKKGERAPEEITWEYVCKHTC